VVCPHHATFHRRLPERLLLLSRESLGTICMVRMSCLDYIQMTSSMGGRYKNERFQIFTLRFRRSFPEGFITKVSFHLMRVKMKTQYYTATSLDGYLATEDDSLDWLFPLGDLDTSSNPEFISAVGALAMGSATYEWMVRNAEMVYAQTGSAWPYSQPAWIFTSRNLPKIEGADIRFVQGDVRPVHAEMRSAAGTKNIWIVGGGDLAGQFHDAGLLDELIVQVGSVTLGQGKPLFPRRILSPALYLTDVRQLGEGMVELRYSIRKG